MWEPAMLGNLPLLLIITIKNSPLQIKQLAQWVLCQERPMTEMATCASNRWWSKERNSVCGLFLFPQGFGGADKFETRLLIPSKMGGAVIGKKGCNIQQLRSDYNATIRFSQLRAEWTKANFSKSQGPRCSRARANHVCHLRGPGGN